MKEYLLQIAKQQQNPLRAKNLMREYLQARVLVALQRAGAMIPLAFHGGTALRFLFNLNRYSEYLYFTLEHPQKKYDFRFFLDRILKELTAEGYQISIKINDKKTVHSGFIQFQGVLFEAGLSNHKDEKLSIKIEIDTKPPQGAILKNTVIRRYMTLQVQHHDRASMLAGKIHAIIMREYTKGRDFYDLFWYLSDRSWPNPNIELLNNALKQTGWPGPVLTQINWRTVLRDRIRNLKWQDVISDIRPFLEDEKEIELLTAEYFFNLLSDPQ